MLTCKVQESTNEGYRDQEDEIVQAAQESQMDSGLQIVVQEIEGSLS